MMKAMMFVVVTMNITSPTAGVAIRGQSMMYALTIAWSAKFIEDSTS